MTGVLEKLKQQMVKEVETRIGPLLEEIKRGNKAICNRLDQLIEHQKK